MPLHATVRARVDRRIALLREVAGCLASAAADLEEGRRLSEGDAVRAAVAASASTAEAVRIAAWRNAEDIGLPIGWTPDPANEAAWTETAKLLRQVAACRSRYLSAGGLRGSGTFSPGQSAGAAAAPRASGG